MGQGRRPPRCGERRQAPVTSAVDATVGRRRRKFRLALPAPPGDAHADGWAAPFPGSAVPPPSAPRSVTIGAIRNLMRLSPRTRFAAAAFALVLICVFGAGCAEGASPTTPTLPDSPAPPPTPEPPAPALIQAEEVPDRETLRLFVEAAAHEASTNIAAADEAYVFFDATFRPEGPWRKGRSTCSPATRTASASSTP